MSEFEQYMGLYVQIAPRWAVDEFGQQSLEKGDAISNTCKKIVDDNDTTCWAYDALGQCGSLLFLRKRWPDHMNSLLDARRPIQYVISKWQYKVGLHDTRLYRMQRWMTRDPYIYFYACCVELDRMQFVDVVTIPFYLFRLNTWLWRIALIRGKRSRLYEMIERKPNHKLEYVNNLRLYRWMAYRKRIG